MRWEEIREQYAEQWLVIEALEAHTEDDRRKLEQMTCGMTYCHPGRGLRRG